MRKQLDNMILPLTDDLKCLNKELTNSDGTLNSSTSLLLNNKSDDELKFLLTESVDSNFILNDEESDQMRSIQNNKDTIKNVNIEKHFFITIIILIIIKFLFFSIKFFFSINKIIYYSFKKNNLLLIKHNSI